MRIFPGTAIAALTLSVALAGSASAAAQFESTHSKKTVGYQDENGTFHPLRHAVPDVTIAPTTGKYAVTFEITLKSAFPAHSTIFCEAHITEISEETLTTPPYELSYAYEEEGTGSVASGAVGSTVTCVVDIPYSWIVPKGTATSKVTSSVTASYDVIAYNSTSSTITLSSVEGLRTSSSELAVPATVPATGTTTNATVDVTL